MKLYYIANVRIPTEKAYGVNIAQMCYSFAKNGVDVSLIVPQRKNSIEEDIFNFYNVDKNFSIHYIPIVDWVGKGFYGYWISQISFSFKLLFSKFKRSESIIYTRDEWSAWLLSLFGHSIFYEMQGFPVKWRWVWYHSMKCMKGIVCANQWKIEQCNKIFGIPLEKLILARNGFDERAFDVKLTKNDAREKINLPVEKNIVVYAGHLYDWKGVDTVVAAAKLTPEFLFVLVGGDKNEIGIFKNKHVLSNNTVIAGQRPHKEIPIYLQAADILLLPNSSYSANSRFAGYSTFDTSPIKLFEYLASGRPIIASDLPAIREVLNEKNACLLPPDDSVLLAQTIKDFLKNQEMYNLLAKRGLEDVKEFTWEKRAKKIRNKGLGK